jgi:transposase
MIAAGVQVYVASMPVDFRKGATGLMALVRDGGADPFNGALYVFRSKRADQIKAVWFDGTGVCGSTVDGLSGRRRWMAWWR